jgi:hypothetical protein
MSRFEPPTADNALLGFLLTVLSVVACLGFVAYWLLQPTVLINGGPDGLVSQRIGVSILAAAPPDIETPAIMLAQLENERQGLRPVAFAAAEPRVRRSAVAAAPVAKTSANKTSVKKRVVRRERRDDNGSFHRRDDWSAQRRDDWSPTRRSAWASDNFGRRSFGGFGDWFR